jgi:hypothetical protein
LKSGLSQKQKDRQAKNEGNYLYSIMAVLGAEVEARAKAVKCNSLFNDNKVKSREPKQ